MSDEREITELIKERDYLEEMCDKLAARIAPPHVLGEHSSDNDPWLNALNYGDSTDWQNGSKDEEEAVESEALAVQADDHPVGNPGGLAAAIAVDSVLRLARHLDTLADGDRHYANLIRQAIGEPK